MAFGKSLYLLEALLPTENETVRYSHITGEVTERPILLQTLELTHVTVSNLVKLIIANSFVLRLLLIPSESFLHFWGNLGFRKRRRKSMRRSLWFAVTAMSLVCGLAVTSAVGQAVYGSVLGTVTDPSGAAVNGAKVTATSQTKNVSVEATTNESGNYSITHLIPDVYTIRVEAQGFKVLQNKDVQVTADAAARVDGQLQVGGASETVEVTSEAPQLKTDRADVSTEFNTKQVEDMPILNRNFTSLQLMAPGSQKMGWSHAATENPQGSQQIVTQGQHFSGTAFELDGTDNQDPILGIIVVNPNLDAVTEAKVALQNYDAEFGKAVGSVVTAQTKSGSNDLHGSGFYFRRSDAQQARDPFTQSPNQADPITHRLLPRARWQQFGGTLGGPIIKNKLFFFGDYQGTRQNYGVSGVFTMPTALVRSTCTASNPTGYCNLSEYDNAFTGNKITTGGGVIFDPATGNSSGANRTRFCGPAGCATEPNWIPLTAAAAAAEPVGPGGPVKSIASPAALNVLAALPAAQLSTVTNNFTGSGSGPYTQNSFDTRIDFAATSTISVFGRFSLDYFSLSGKGLLGAMGGPGDGGGSIAPGLAGSSKTHNYSLSTGVTKTFSASLLADFRFGWFKYNPITAKPDGGTPMSAFGIPGANTSDPKTGGLGFFSLGGDPIVGQGCTANNGGAGCMISSFGDGLGPARCNCPLTESEQQIQFVNNWTKTIRNHILKVGGDIRYAKNLRIPSDNNRTGEYNFSPEATADFSTTPGGNGLDLATFILGDVTQFQRYVNNPAVAPPGERQKRFFFYGQDTWRATSKLTINYGLRWEIYFPETVTSKGGGGFANITDLGGAGAIRVAGIGGIGSNGNVKNDWHAFAPRFGIAYQATPKTVVRMGYGRSYDIGVFGSNFGHTVTQNLPVLLKQNYKASNFINGATDDRTPLFTLDAGPNSIAGIDPATAFPAVPSNGILPFSSLGGTISGVHIRPPKQVLPRVDAYNATVQRQMTNSISLEVAYVGSKGTHGFAGDGPNYDVNPKSMALYGVIDPVATAANGGTPTVYADNLRRPLCRPILATDTCTGIAYDLGNYYGNDAASTYNAFEVKAEKRFTNGLQFISHYTYSHADGYADPYYAIDHTIAWGSVNWNRNHVWVFSPVYELPFGKGKKYMGNAGRGMDYLVGGWQLSNNTTWGSGLPWDASFSNCGSEQDVGVCRPNRGSGSFHTGVSGGIDSQHHNITFYTPVPDITNPASPPGPFADPTRGHLGNIRRNSFHGPRAFTSDLSVVKRFPIHERFNMQFRTDFFNLFNHPVLANPSNTIDGTGQNDGKITGLEFGYPMRQIQFALRLDF